MIPPATKSRRANPRSPRRGAERASRAVRRRLRVADGQRGISGVMLESFLVPGRQDLGDPLTYGQSVTDACMGWLPTVDVLEKLATASAKRRCDMSTPPRLL